MITMNELSREEMLSLRGGSRGGSNNGNNYVYAPVISVSPATPGGNSHNVTHGATIVIGSGGSGVTGGRHH